MDQFPELPPTLTIPEGAKRWGCSPGKLRSLIKKGIIPAIKPGNRILIRVDEGDSWWRTSGKELVNAVSIRRPRRKKALFTT